MKLIVFCSVVIAFAATSALALPVEHQSNINDKTSGVEKKEFELNEQLVKINSTAAVIEIFSDINAPLHNDKADFISTLVAASSGWFSINLSPNLNFDFNDLVIDNKDIEGLHINSNDAEPAWLNQCIALAGLR